MNQTNQAAQLAEQIELKKFSAMAEDWWNPSGSCGPLHQINPIRLKFVQQYVKLDQMRIVDIGCGGGIFSESLAQSGAEVTGIDLNPDLITVAKLHAKQNQLNINYHHTSIENFTHQHGEKFDVAVCMELLEHLLDPQKVILDCAKLVKPGGKVFFSTINRNWLAYIKAIIAAEYILGMLPKGTHDYQNFITPAELCRAARIADLELIALSGFDYNPFKKNFFLCENLNVNYLAGFQRKSG